MRKPMHIDHLPSVPTSDVTFTAPYSIPLPHTFNTYSYSY